MRCIVVHYSEIGTKGQNRRYFEKKLVGNITDVTGGDAVLADSRIVIKKAKNIDSLRYLPGIAYFAEANETAPKMDRIRKAVVTAAKKSSAKTFRVTSQRSDKSFPHTSMELNKMLGSDVWKATKKKVDLHGPQLEIFVEIAGKAYIYTDKISGAGGLPVGTAGKVVCLLSGGIDSPVAAYRMMSRGCKVVFVHFHNYDPFIDKIKDLVKILSGYQGSSVAYFVPFKEAQQEIIKKTKPKYRMLLYRRLMMRIAEEIMRREKALGIVTGDSVSQVASQTLENLNVIYDATAYPVFSPLIGTGKQEIVDNAKIINTYETSIKQYTDCCSVLIGKHPATRADITRVKQLERKIRISPLARKSLKKTEIFKV